MPDIAEKLSQTPVAVNAYTFLWFRRPSVEFVRGRETRAQRAGKRRRRARRARRRSPDLAETSDRRSPNV